MSHIPHVQPNQYKDGKEIMKTMRLMHITGELNQLQNRIFNPVRPIEELYDLQLDSQETVNLADDPRYKKTLLSLRNQLYDHMVSSGDLGLIPEPILEDLGKRYKSKVQILRQPENKTLVRDLINIIEAGEQQDVTRLLHGLKDETPSVSYWAATWLGIRKVTDAGDALVETTHHASPAVRIAAALALCRLGRPDDGEDTILTTMEDDNWLAGMYAIRALEWSGIRTPAARAAVMNALDSPYEYTRRIAKRLGNAVLKSTLHVR